MEPTIRQKKLATMERKPKWWSTLSIRRPSAFAYEAKGTNLDYQGRPTVFNADPDPTCSRKRRKQKKTSLVWPFLWRLFSNGGKGSNRTKQTCFLTFFKTPILHRTTINYKQYEPFNSKRGYQFMFMPFMLYPLCRSLRQPGRPQQSHIVARVLWYIGQ